MQKLDRALDEVAEKLNTFYDTFGNLKEDELEAREQLDQIKEVLIKAKCKLNEYSLPMVPDYYYTYMAEAKEAIDDVKVELNKKPISIKTLNVRVDTARDLAVKL